MKHEITRFHILSHETLFKVQVLSEQTGLGEEAVIRIAVEAFYNAKEESDMADKKERLGDLSKEEVARINKHADRQPDWKEGSIEYWIKEGKKLDDKYGKAPK